MTFSMKSWMWSVKSGVSTFWTFTKRQKGKNFSCSFWCKCCSYVHNILWLYTHTHTHTHTYTHIHTHTLMHILLYHLVKHQDSFSSVLGHPEFSSRASGNRRWDEAWRHQMLPSSHCCWRACLNSAEESDVRDPQHPVPEAWSPNIMEEETEVHGVWKMGDLALLVLCSAPLPHPV